MAVANSIEAALRFETEVADEVEAAITQFDRNDQPFTIGLLLDVMHKERESLDAIEQSLESLRLALARRRRTIDQQEEILLDLSQALMKGKES